MKLKTISVILIVGLLLGSLPVYGQVSITPLSILISVEEILYGKTQEGSLLGRLEQIELEIYGKAQEGPVMTRIEKARNFLESSASGSNLKAQLNLAEWGFLARLTAGEPLMERLDNIEIDFFGSPQTGSITDRIEQLMMFIWGTTSLDSKVVEIKEETLVKIRLLNKVDSATNKVGDTIRYRVTEDVVIDGRVVIPKGAEGFGKVTEVVVASSVGRDGRVLIDFGSVQAFDGSNVPLKVSEKATEKNTSLELAAGASMAGVLLLGSPVGLVGGYFIKGKDVQIPIGTEFYVETARSRQVFGFNLVPAY